MVTAKNKMNQHRSSHQKVAPKKTKSCRFCSCFVTSTNIVKILGEIKAALECLFCKNSEMLNINWEFCKKKWCEFFIYLCKILARIRTLWCSIILDVSIISFISFITLSATTSWQASFIFLAWFFAEDWILWVVLIIGAFKFRVRLCHKLGSS